MILPIGSGSGTQGLSGHVAADVAAAAVVADGRREYWDWDAGRWQDWR